MQRAAGGNLVASAGMIARARASLAASAHIGILIPRNFYHAVCRDRFGNIKWEESVENLIVNEGLDDILAKYLKGSGYTADWYIGLMSDSPTIAGADTLASHAGWSEATGYTGDRKAWVGGSVSGGSVSNSASPAVFAMNATDDIGGCFLCAAATGTSAVLYGAAAFSVGDRGVVNGDTLTVTETNTMAAA